MLYLKILDSELSKDLFGTTTNLNTSSGVGATSWSLCSPQQLTGIIQTTGNQPATATPILQNLTTAATLAQPIELTSAPNNGNYIISAHSIQTSATANGTAGFKQHSNEPISFLDNTNAAVNNQLSTLKLIGSVDLTPKLLDAQQPQFAELKTVGLLNSDAFLSTIFFSQNNDFNLVSINPLLLELNNPQPTLTTANLTTATATTTTTNTNNSTAHSSTLSEKAKTQGIRKTCVISSLPSDSNK